MRTVVLWTAVSLITFEWVESNDICFVIILRRIGSLQSVGWCLWRWLQVLLGESNQRIRFHRDEKPLKTPPESHKIHVQATRAIKLSIKRGLLTHQHSIPGSHKHTLKNKPNNIKHEAVLQSVLFRPRHTEQVTWRAFQLALRWLCVESKCLGMCLCRYTQLIEVNYWMFYASRNFGGFARSELCGFGKLCTKFEKRGRNILR